jgi:hypothetical protein
MAEKDEEKQQEDVEGNMRRQVSPENETESEGQAKRSSADDDKSEDETEGHMKRT